MPDPKPKAAKANGSQPPKPSSVEAKPAEPSNDASSSAKDAKDAKDKHTKPEKPDDEAYKANLAAAEKELEAAKTRLVRTSGIPNTF